MFWTWTWWLYQGINLTLRSLQKIYVYVFWHPTVQFLYCNIKCEIGMSACLVPCLNSCSYRSDWILIHLICLECPKFLPAVLFLPSSGIFREFGGARCAHNIVKYPQCRQHALMTIQQLVLSPNGDDDMGTLLGLMHSAPPTELQLKTDILRVRLRNMCLLSY